MSEAELNRTLGELIGQVEAVREGQKEMKNDFATLQDKVAELHLSTATDVAERKAVKSYRAALIAMGMSLVTPVIVAIIKAKAHF